MNAYEQLNVNGIRSRKGLTPRFVAKSMEIGRRTEATAEFDANSVRKAVDTENTTIIPKTLMKSNLESCSANAFDNPDTLTALARE